MRSVVDRNVVMGRMNVFMMAFLISARLRSFTHYYSCSSSVSYMKQKTAIILTKEMNYKRITEVMSQSRPATVTNYMASYFFSLPYIRFLA